MTELLDILGKHLASPDVAKQLARYPKLHAEADDSTPEEGIDAVRYLRSEADGLLIKLSGEGEVLAIFLMGEGKDGFTQFAGQLPGELTFASRPGDVLRRLGAPAYHRPASRIGQFKVGPLLRFDRPGHSLHFQFRADESGIELLTAMTARAVPGRSAR